MSDIKTIIDGGKLSFDLYDLFEGRTGEARAKVIDAMAINTEVITEVANQIIDGWTTDGSHGSTGFGGNPDAVHGIDGARMRIAKASSEIAAKEIELLGAELKRAKERENLGWNAYYKLMRCRS